MAEYIDREPLMKHYQMVLEDISGDEEFKDLSENIQDSLYNLKNEPTADVIECSELAKLEEKIMDKLSQKSLEPDYQHDCEDWHIGIIFAEEIIQEVFEEYIGE